MGLKKIFSEVLHATGFVGPLTGNVTGNCSGSSGSCTGNAATVSTNANLTGDVTSVGNATTLTNAPVIAKVLTGYTSGPGTVAATDSILQAIQKLNGNRPFVNVKENGAVGDGVTDDTAAIQAIISASSGRVLYFPAGTYIAGSLNLISNIVLMGEGVGSVLKLKAATTYSNLVLDTLDSVLITNLKIDGNKAAQSVVKYGVMTIASTKVIIDKVWFTGTYGHAVFLTGASSKVTVTNNKFWDIGTDSTARAVFALDSSYVIITDNNIESVLGFGLTLQNTPYSVIDSNTIGTITNYDGIIVYNSDSTIISNNSINTAGDSGIVLELSDYNTVSGNNIKGVTYVGIYLAGASYNNIIGNTVKDAGQSANNTYNDVQIQSSGGTHSTYNTITGNVLYATAANKTKYGIHEEDANQNYNVSNCNTTGGQVTAAVLLAGAKSTSLETKDGQLFFRAPTAASYTRVATFYNPSATGIPFVTVGKQEADAADAAALFGYDAANNLGWLGIAGDGLGTGIHFKRGGNVGIGTTTPTAKLSIASPDTTTSPTIGLRVAENSAYGFDVDQETLSVGRLDLLGVFNNVRTAILSVMRDSVKVGIGVSAPTAALHLPASTAAANTASLKITPGIVATAPVSGNIESDGTNLYFTNSVPTRLTLVTNLTGPITSVGNATSIASQTGTGTTLVVSASPTLTGTLTCPAIDGGIAANDDITIQGTSDSTRTTSYVLLQPNGGKVGIGTTTPTYALHVIGTAAQVAPLGFFVKKPQKTHVLEQF